VHGTARTRWGRGQMRRYPGFEQRDQFRLQKGVFVRDVEADEAIERRMSAELPLERRALLVVHDEDQVRPVEHVRVDPCERLLTGSRRSHVEIRPLAEKPLRRRTAHPVVAAHEKDPAGRAWPIA